MTATTDRNAALFDDDLDRPLAHLVELLAAETAALGEILPAASAAQWSASPVPRPREDTTERASGGHGDPTPSVAMDDRRLALRAQLGRSAYHVREAIVQARAVRRGLEITLARWEGQEGSPG